MEGYKTDIMDIVMYNTCDLHHRGRGLYRGGMDRGPM